MQPLPLLLLLLLSPPITRALRSLSLSGSAGPGASLAAHAAPVASSTHACRARQHAHGWHCASLAPNFHLHWSFPNATTIELALEVQPTSDLATLDWFALGLSEAGGMPGADIALLQRDTSARSGWSLTDMFATQATRPDVDAKQDKTLLGVEVRKADQQGGLPVEWAWEVRWRDASARPGWGLLDMFVTEAQRLDVDAKQDKALLGVEETAAGLVRGRIAFPLLSCDDKQDRPIVAGIPSFVIFAYGQGEFSYHGSSHRGNAVLTFLPDVSSPPSDSGAASPASDTHTLTIQMPGITIPTNDTDPYLCMDFELPGSEAMPYHIVDFSSFKNTTRGPSQPFYVHHMVLYNCSSKPPTFGRTSPYSCVETMSGCATFVLVATSKDATTLLPPEAGFRIGAGAMRYVTLQIHYNNVQLDSGLVDSSGFKITYTPHLRPNDMGVLALGMVGYVIPARSPTWSTGPTICPPGCTQRFTQPLTLVYGLLHMHKIGRTVSTQHYRRDDGGTGGWRELQPVGVRDYFSFGFQPDIVVPNATSLLLPGDALATTCTYSNPYPHDVKQGPRSSDEMCFNFLMYYPVAAADGVASCFELPWLRDKGRVLCANPEEMQQDDPPAKALPERQASLLQGATPYVPPRPSNCPREQVM